ncbi:MAG: hypothetical protein JST09_18975 [Bacteroidetes bacterium]|nr:hypothetical protein [Bacteroidota bacterium]
MSKKKNRYKQEAKKKHFLSGMNEGLPTKGNAKNTVLETGKDILIGVLGGGLLGAVIGKPSLAVGIITTGAGHYTGNRLVQLLGIGIMAANGFQKSGTVSGLEGFEGVKERLQAYKESLQEKFYLDKILKKKVAAATNGVGELQYFTYNDPMNGHLAALNDIEQQVAESAMQFQGQMRGDDDFQVGIVELDERLY